MKFFENQFNKNQQKIENSTITNSVVIQASGNVGVNEEFLQLLNEHKSDERFLNHLLAEKLGNSRKLIIEGEAKKAEQIIDTIYTASVKSISAKNICLLNYLKIILEILDNSIDKATKMLSYVEISLSYKNNIEDFLLLQNNNHNNFSLTAKRKKDLLFMYVALYILFRTFKFDYLVSNFKPLKDDSHIQDYFYGLSLLNIQNFAEAVQALDSAIQKQPSPKYFFCKSLAEVNLHLSKINDNGIDFNLLRTQYNELIEYGNLCSEFRDIHTIIFDLTSLKVLIFIEPESFLTVYNNLSSAQKESSDFQIQLGHYYQKQGQYDKAICTYTEISKEKHTSLMTFSITSCYLMQDRFEDIINFFEKSDNHQIPPTISIYLFAVHRQTPKRFDILFNKYFADSCKDVDGLSSFIELHTCSKRAKEILYAKTKELKLQILESSNMQKILFAVFAAEMSDFALSEKFTSNIKNPTGSNLEMASSLLFRIKDFESRTKVGELFVRNDFKNYKILSNLAECYAQKKKYISAFPLFKESFSLQNDRELAVSLINLAALIETIKIEDIQEYLDFVEKEEDPQILLIVAQTYCKFSFHDKAEKLSYKAVYLLQGHNNGIYEQFLSLSLKMIGGPEEHNVDFNRVVDDVVVFLKPEVSDELNDQLLPSPNQYEEVSMLTICINQELEFSNDTFAIGALHISKSNPLYLKLINKKSGDIIKQSNTLYKISSIINKNIHAFRYALQRVDDSNSDFFMKKIHFDANKDVKQQLQDSMREFEQPSDRLASYYFKDSSIGLPIECIIGNYDDYIEVVRFLLYSKDEALYAGLNDIEYNSNTTYVITLSTLVILGVLENLSILDKYHDKIFISESLLDFIKKRSVNASKTLVVSPGKLGMDKMGELRLTPPDDSSPDFWNAIYEAALNFKTHTVSNEERTDFFQADKNMDIEELFAKLQIHVCQIDSFIIAKKKKGIYLSDDLFFRHLCTFFKIQTVNHTYLYKGIESAQVKNIVLKLMKTNYIYINAIDIDKAFIAEYFKSISSNERKRMAYSKLFPENMLLKSTFESGSENTLT